MGKGVLDGRVAIITGAAGGIGSAVSTLFAAEGCKAVMADMDEENGKALERRLKTLHGEDAATFIRTDVSDEKQASRCVEETIERYGSVNILVNNAAIHHIATLFETTSQMWQKTIDVNLKSAFLFSKFVAWKMVENKVKGSIVNVSSIQGIRGGVLSAAYAASKAGIIGLTKSLAQELMPYGIRVNAVAPRAINTALFRKYLEARGMTDDDVKKRYLFGRLGEPMEVANTILFLASDNSSYITGEVIVVGGDF
ncbi:MAG: SDR family NAD(P)-dependent oxidoreductase [Candidatus Caldarchaeum sp.]